MMVKLLDTLQLPIVSRRSTFGMDEVLIAVEDWIKTFQVLHANGYSLLTDLCGAHFPESDAQYHVIAHVHNLQINHRIRLKTVARDNSNPQVPSLTGLYSGANWMERETFDFYGIQFIGHPNLTRILNSDDMTAYPMRKDFPLEDDTRDDKKDEAFGR